MPMSETLARSAISELPSGLNVTPLDLAAGEKIVISEREEYAYYCYYLQPNQHVSVKHLACACVFIPATHNTLQAITVNNVTVSVGGTALAELTELDIVATQGSGYVLVAGSKVPAPDAKKQLTVHAADQHYVVKKPWGHELWINGEHPIYSFKGIVVKQGAQTSLQYHRHKIEVALLCQGVMDLVYKANRDANNDDVRSEDLAVVQLEGLGKIAVEPGTLHRMRGATDIYYYEVSTPHLDDVIRVQDDNKRPHGRILKEHMAS